MSDRFSAHPPSCVLQQPTRNKEDIFHCENDIYNYSNTGLKTTALQTESSGSCLFIEHVSEAR